MPGNRSRLACRHAVLRGGSAAFLALLMAAAGVRADYFGPFLVKDIDPTNTNSNVNNLSGVATSIGNSKSTTPESN